MTKKFFISRKAQDGVTAPQLDRFQRIEKLNALLALGWVIKGFENSDDESWFLLEKQA